MTILKIITYNLYIIFTFNLCTEMSKTQFCQKIFYKENPCWNCQSTNVGTQSHNFILPCSQLYASSFLDSSVKDRPFYLITSLHKFALIPPSVVPYNVSLRIGQSKRYPRDVWLVPYYRVFLKGGINYSHACKARRKNSEFASSSNPVVG